MSSQFTAAAMLPATACYHGNAENTLFPLNRLRYAPTIPDLVDIYDDNTTVSPQDNCRLLRSGSLIAIGHALAEFTHKSDQTRPGLTLIKRCLLSKL